MEFIDIVESYHVIINNPTWKVEATDQSPDEINFPYGFRISGIIAEGSTGYTVGDTFTEGFFLNESKNKFMIPSLQITFIKQ